MKRILVVGELNVDLIFHGIRTYPTLGREVHAERYALTLGSASAICAVGLAKLGNAVSYASTVGHDSWGESCLRTLREAGVDVTWVTQDPAL